MRKFLLLLIAVLGVSLGLAAQTLGAETAPLIDYETTITTLGGFAIGIMAVVGVIKRMVPGLHGIGTQIVSWVVAILSALIFWWLQTGMFAGMLWYIALLYGFGGGLIANGLADINLVQGIINLFRHK